MSNYVRTARGKVIDMHQLFVDNQKSIAVGNASLNARGDLVKHGKVVKTVEERRAEYEVANSRSSTTISLAPDAKLTEEKAMKEVEEFKATPKPKKVKKEIKEEVVVPVQETADTKSENKEPETNDNYFSLKDIIHG